jgi:5-methylcytosine-specific restriction protein A
MQRKRTKYGIESYKSCIAPVNHRGKGEQAIPFDTELDKTEMNRQKQLAKKLRQSAWWQRKIAKGVCYYCQRHVDPGELTMDHVVPLTRGGKSTKGNLVPACKACNSRKKYLLPVEWDEYLERLAYKQS